MAIFVPSYFVCLWSAASKRYRNSGMRSIGTACVQNSATEADMLKMRGLRLLDENSYGTLIEPRINVINIKTITKEENDESCT
ncbi:MAG: hypothetical protein LW713_11430 [Acetobacteraceae bacterium]|jgi:hypothetical protein|nr:hypothetical protein [Acetobacteraceae bacterium]